MEALVPRDEVSASAMILKAPDPWAELAGRFQAAASADPEWFLDYTRTSPPGPLPYHPKLGLSRAEYEQLQSLSKQMRLVPVGRARLTVRERRKGVFRFEGGSELSDLTGLELDTTSETLKIPVGTCTAFRQMSVPVGAWEGYNCRVDETPDASLHAVWIDFSLGRRPDRSSGILLYRYKVLEGSRLQSRADVYITYTQR